MVNPSIVPSLQVKTQGLSSTSPSLTGIDRTTYTTVTPIVTGTGSITATPTAYTTAVTTTATSTTPTTGQETVLGKRFRRSSTKYEDYEQPLAIVSFSILYGYIQYC